MTEYREGIRTVCRKHGYIRLLLALVVLAACGIAWSSPAEAETPAWVEAAHGSPDRVLRAWADLTAGRGGVAPTIGLEYGRELGRFAFYGIGTIEVFDRVSLAVGAGVRYALTEATEVGFETSFSRTSSHVWGSLELDDRLRIGIEKGLQGRYDAFSATYSLTDSFDVSVFVGSNQTYWVRISVNL